MEIILEACAEVPNFLPEAACLGTIVRRYIKVVTIRELKAS